MCLQKISETVDQYNMLLFNPVFLFATLNKYRGLFQTLQASVMEPCENSRFGLLFVNFSLQQLENLLFFQMFYPSSKHGSRCFLNVKYFEWLFLAERTKVIYFLFVFF